jgi:hypothetical protein
MSSRGRSWRRLQKTHRLPKTKQTTGHEGTRNERPAFASVRVNSWFRFARPHADTATRRFAAAARDPRVRLRHRRISPHSVGVRAESRSHTKLILVSTSKVDRRPLSLWENIRAWRDNFCQSMVERRRIDSRNFTGRSHNDLAQILDCPNHIFARKG